MTINADRAATYESDAGSTDEMRKSMDALEFLKEICEDYKRGVRFYGQRGRYNGNQDKNISCLGSYFVCKRLKLKACK